MTARYRTRAAACLVAGVLVHAGATAAEYPADCYNDADGERRSGEPLPPDSLRVTDEDLARLLEQLNPPRKPDFEVPASPTRTPKR